MIAQRVSEGLSRLSTGPIALLGLVVFVLFIALVLPGQAERADEYSGEAGSPDGSFYYTAEQLYQWAEAYGEDGREAYVRARLTFDVLWPLVYTLFLGTALSVVGRRAYAPGRPWRLANLAPLLGLTFDYLENLCTSLVMVRYPEPTAVVASLAGLVTLVKWIFVYGSFVLLLLGLVVALWRLLQATWQK